MSMKAAFCALTLALTIAACGEKKEAATPEPTTASMATMETMREIAGGGDNSAMGQFATHMGRVADALASVTDEASAKAAAKVIAKANEDMIPVAKTLNAQTDAEKAAGAMANAQRLMTSQQKIGMAASNLAMNHPDLMEILGDALDDMPEVK